MSILNFLKATRVLFLCLSTGLKIPLASMQIFHDLNIQQHIEVSQRLGVFAFGTLIAPNMILTCKSLDNIKFLLLGSSQNAWMYYQVDHSIKHDVFDLQLLILRENISNDVVVPIDLAPPHMTYEFLNKQLAQFLFIGSLERISKMPSSIFDARIKQGIGVLDLMEETLNSRFHLMDKENPGLHIISPSTLSQNPEFKYDAYDKGGAVLYKDSETYKLAGVVVSRPDNLKLSSNLKLEENAFYFYDIESIRDWINNSLREIEKPVLEENDFSACSSYDSSDGYDSSSDAEYNEWDSEEDDKAILTPTFRSQNWEEKQESIKSSKKIHFYFQQLETFPSNIGNNFILLDKKTVLQQNFNLKDKISFAHKTIQLDHRYSSMPFPLCCNIKVQNIHGPELDIEPIKIAKIHDLHNLEGKEVFIFGKKNNINYIISFKLTNISEDGILEDLEFNLDILNLKLEPGVYLKSNNEFELVGVISSSYNNVKHNIQFITHEVRTKIEIFLSAPKVNFISVKSEIPSHEGSFSILINPKIVLSNHCSMPKYNGKEYIAEKEVELFDNYLMKIKFLDEEVLNVSPVSIYKFNNFLELQNKEFIVYGEGFDASYKNTFKLDDLQIKSIKFIPNKKYINYCLGIYIEAAGEIQLVGLLNKDFGVENYYHIYWLTEKIKDTMKSLETKK